MVHNIGFNKRNSYSWMKKIHMVWTMGIIVNARRIIIRSFGRPKNLFSLEV
jgi:hypothetical protein